MINCTFSFRSYIIIIKIIENDKIIDQLALTSKDCQFEGKYTVHNKSRREIINYLINNNIIKVISREIFEISDIYIFTLTRSKMLELL